MTRPDGAVLDMLRALIAFDTTSRNSNLELIDFVRKYLGGLGVESELLHDASRSKANLYATLGPSDSAGIILSGHTDVVPVDGQDWHSDPFVVTERDGRLYGRGTADMKGFVALVLALAPEFLRRGLKIPLHIALSYDEEVGCVGVHSLVDKLALLPVRPRFCIVGEPSEMQVILGHKGGRSYRARVRGVEAHSSLAPRAVNAIEYAAELIAEMKRMARSYAANGPYDDAYDVAHMTMQASMIGGGTAINIVPKDCSFMFEFRHLAEEDPDRLFDTIRDYAKRQLEPAMKAVAADAGFSFEPIYAYPALETAADAEVTTFAKALTGRNDDAKVAFGTEAGLFSTRAGIPSVVCGPGSITQAHKPDEFITLDQLVQGEAFLRRLMDRMCAEPPNPTSEQTGG